MMMVFKLLCGIICVISILVGSLVNMVLVRFVFFSWWCVLSSDILLIFMFR